MDISKLTEAEKVKLATLLKLKQENEKYNKLGYYFPDNRNNNFSQETSGTIFERDLYPKHLKFFEAGKDHRVRIFSAANRVGKSFAGCYEASLHLTGMYPDWWKGKRFTKPVTVWVAGYTKAKTQESLVKYLLGSRGDLGSGLIPRSAIIHDSVAAMAGFAGGIASVRVKHVSGGESLLQAKSYDEEARAFSASAIEAVILDEEPPLAVFAEAAMRTITTNGVVLLTFTADKGLSETVMHFFKDGVLKEGSQGETFIISCSIYNVPHLSEDMRQSMLENCPAYLRSAKIHGLPYQGDGLVFSLPEHEFLIEPVDLTTKGYGWAFGLDVGVRLTSMLIGCYDRLNDTWYITKEYQGDQKSVSENATSIRIITQNKLSGIIDKASLQSNIIDLSSVFQAYTDAGLSVFPSYSSKKVEVGLLEVYDRLRTGRLKIFNTCSRLITEMRLYRRDEKGNLKGIHDTIDALRYLVDGGVKVLTYLNDDDQNQGNFNYMRKDK